MQKVYLYSSLGNALQEFVPLVPNEVSFYVCGPTVYNHPHIGNIRPVIVFDTWRRLFLELGYKVTFVSNYTDVDDKIIARAAELGVSEQELTTSVIKEYEEAVHAVGSMIPDVTPKPTVYMPQIISYIDDLVKTGYAYQSNDGVYFRVSKIKDYGSLSGNTPESLLSGARIEVNEGKESPLDFALWKETSTGIRWETPWCVGRPGWHTECCVMIHSLFPKTNGLIDIHGGGFDLKFPHHENEIAQAEAHNGNHLAHYWLHNGFININNEKMSKSLGNVLLATDVIKMYGGAALRLMILNAHYRAPVSFSEETISEAQKNVKKIETTLKSLVLALQSAGRDLENVKGQGEEEFLHELCQDLNTPNAITILYGEVKNANQLLRTKDVDLDLVEQSFAKIRDYLRILGLPVEIKYLTNSELGLYCQYLEAKQNKDFVESDRLRKILLEGGIL
ncbi:MAG: cysteine--tRNA ligase [Candidatus Enteromonas sp.]